MSEWGGGGGGEVGGEVTGRKRGNQGKDPAAVSLHWRRGGSSILVVPLSNDFYYGFHTYVRTMKINCKIKHGAH